MPKIQKDKPIPVTDKTEAIFQLVETGMPLERAYEAVKPGKKLTASNKSRLLAKRTLYSISQPQIVKKAVQAVSDTLDMQEVNGVKPTVSNRLQAASMVLDRVEPVVNKNLNINANLDISPVDLSRYVDKG